MHDQTSGLSSSAVSDCPPAVSKNAGRALEIIRTANSQHATASIGSSIYMVRYFLPEIPAVFASSVTETAFLLSSSGFTLSNEISSSHGFTNFNNLLYSFLYGIYQAVWPGYMAFYHSRMDLSNIAILQSPERQDSSIFSHFPCRILRCSSRSLTMASIRNAIHGDSTATGTPGQVFASG